MPMKLTTTIFLVFLLILTGCNKDDSDKNKTAAVIGSTAPNFKLADKDGNYRELYEFRGKYVVVDFWASWCSICRRENPKMQSLSSKYNSQVQVIGVNLDQKVENWQNAVITDQLTYLQLHDTLAFDSEIAQSYQISMIPFIMLLNPQGVILMFSSRTDEIEAKIGQLL